MDFKGVEVPTFRISSDVIKTIMTLKLKHNYYVAIFTTVGKKYAIRCMHRQSAEALEKELQYEQKKYPCIFLSGLDNVLLGITGEDWSV